MRKKSLSQQLIDSEKRNADLQRAYLDATRERDDAKADLAEAQETADLAAAGNMDEAMLRRLAALAYPKDKPEAIKWRDMIDYFANKAEEDKEREEALLKICQDNEIDHTMTTAAVLEAIADKLLDLRVLEDATEKLEAAFETGEKGACVLESVVEKREKEGTPEDVREAAIELLKELGFDVTRLRPVMAGYSYLAPALDDACIVMHLRSQLPRLVA